MECRLIGNALIVARTEDKHIVTCITEIVLPAERINDWQCDGGIYHNEGGYDYDLNLAYPLYPDEYTVLDIAKQKIYDGDSKLKQILLVYTTDYLEEQLC